MPWWWAKLKKPQCLPEQLLCTEQACTPDWDKATVAGWYKGQWLPHSNCSELMPNCSSQELTTWLCWTSPLWLEQAIANCCWLSLRSCAAPLSISGRACSGFAVERGNTNWSASPHWVWRLPLASLMTAITWWRLSTKPPRVTSITSSRLFIYYSRIRGHANLEC